MPRLSRRERAFILSVLAEGNSVASTCRITGANKQTVLNLLVDVARVCRSIHDTRLRNLKCQRIECDELWQFIFKKEKRTTQEDKLKGYGDSWLWLAIDANTKIIISYLVGLRDTECAKHFMLDLASRLSHRVQLTSDGFKPYLEAVEEAFGCDIDFSQLIKAFSTENGTETVRAAQIGNPDMNYVSTSYSERLNLTIRMQDRRFTRKTNGHSKKLRNHAASVDFHVVYYNFVRVHQTLRVTPAMEAGLTDHIWTYEELSELLEQDEAERQDAPLRKLRALLGKDS